MVALRSDGVGHGCILEKEELERDVGGERA